LSPFDAYTIQRYEEVKSSVAERSQSEKQPYGRIFVAEKSIEEQRNGEIDISHIYWKIVKKRLIMKMGYLLV
jgi:hypothetical protein